MNAFLERRPNPCDGQTKEERHKQKQSNNPLRFGGGAEVKKEEELGNIVAEECVSLKFCTRRLIAYIFE